MPASHKSRKEFTEEHVRAARDNWLAHPRWQNFDESKNYEVIIDEMPYPPMPIFAFANLAVGNDPIKSFKGSLKGWGHLGLQKAGFPVVPKRVRVKGTDPAEPTCTLADPEQELQDDINQIINTITSPTERKQIIQARTVTNRTFPATKAKIWPRNCSAS